MSRNASYIGCGKIGESITGSSGSPVSSDGLPIVMLADTALSTVFAGLRLAIASVLRFGASMNIRKSGKKNVKNRFARYVWWAAAASRNGNRFVGLVLLAMFGAVTTLKRIRVRSGSVESSASEILSMVTPPRSAATGAGGVELKNAIIPTAPGVWARAN